MPRRQIWASVLVSVVLIVPLFTLGAILDWADEFFAWLAVGAPGAGVILSALFFHQPPSLRPEPDASAPRLAESLERLARRVDALEKQARKEPVGQVSGVRTPTEPSSGRAAGHS